MARFFVSYSRSVKDEVQKVVDLLRASGHEVWWDGDIPIMADWWSTILNKIEWCEVFIFVTSAKSVESPYCIAELKYANDRQRPVLPFMLDDPTHLTLPLQLPARNQWLVYDGNPTNMLGQINTAYNLIEWQKHQNINTRRPPEPNKGGVSLAKQYQNARQSALDLEFDKARRLLQNIKRLDYGEWGIDCDEWLGRISSYESLIELVDHDATYDKARRNWNEHVRQFGSDFDPHDIEQKLTKNASNIPQWILGLGILILIVGIWWMSSFFTRGNNNPDTENDLTQNVTLVEEDATTPSPLEIAGMTQTQEMADFQLTLDESDRLEATNEVETATAFAPTRAAQQQATVNAILTQTRAAFLALTPSNTPTPTPTLTATPTNTPTLTNTPLPTSTPAPFVHVTSNDDWTPIERDFDGVTMVLVPVGCFVIGSDNGDSDELNGNEVCLEPFWIDKTEVTNEQFGSTGCESRSSEPEQPRNCVDWFEANEHCESRNARLPLEAEWEFAARGSDGLVYPWGNEYISENVIGSDDPTYGSVETAPVGSRPAGASWVGALDMSGNLWEWTSSLYEDYPYDANDGREDNTGDSTEVLRVLRGGSFSDATHFLRSANRSRSLPNLDDNIVGFRCVRSYN